MKLKSRPQDFKVTELLDEDILQSKGEHRVYRVTKRKMTSIEAAAELGHELGIPAGEIAIAGLKDRQGVTVQYMSVSRGQPLRVRREGLIIEDVGCMRRPLDSKDSRGNGFEIIVRDLGPQELHRMRKGLEFVREHGLPNYFDEQRFGNLRHGQGWIFLELLHGRPEQALQQLLTRISRFDNQHHRSFKSALYRHWGDWRACRDIAGKFGGHHSVFEHLRREPDDFAGAFNFISHRVRLIHLFAYQSHMWNRAVVSYLEEYCDPHKMFPVPAREGKLLFPKFEVSQEPGWNGIFPLFGEKFEGVTDPVQLRIYRSLLKEDGVDTRRLQCDVPGFGLKAENRQMVVVPQELRIRPAEPDPLSPGRSLVKVRFALPRGSYATLVLRRLIGPTREDAAEEYEERSRGGYRSSQHGRGAPGQGRGYRGGQGGEQRGDHWPRGEHAADRRGAGEDHYRSDRGHDQRADSGGRFDRGSGGEERAHGSGGHDGSQQRGGYQTDRRSSSRGRGGSQRGGRRDDGRGDSIWPKD
ncbi:MAG: tRNA pseudouridine13 synthase [Planctomycetota bacterium]